MGFHNSRSDSSLFLREDVDSLIIIMVYMDYIIVTRSVLSSINEFISNLHLQFSLKELGILRYFLGVQVSYIADGLCLSQQKHIMYHLNSTSLEDSKPMNVPLVTGKQFSKFECVPLLDPTEYKKVVGSLQYLTLIKPNIA